MLTLRGLELEVLAGILASISHACQIYSNSELNVQGIVSALWYCVSAVSSVSPAALEEGHQLVSQLSQLCGSLRPDGWALRWGAVSAAFMGSAVDLSKICVSLVQVLAVGAPWLHSERGVFEHPAGRGDWGHSFHLQGGRAHGEKICFAVKQPKERSLWILPLPPLQPPLQLKLSFIIYPLAPSSTSAGFRKHASTFLLIHNLLLCYSASPFSILAYFSGLFFDWQ